MKTYQQRKEEVRNMAIEWLHEQSNIVFSWESLAITSDYFKKIGKRYGLIKEFKTNGII